MSAVVKEIKQLVEQNHYRAGSIKSQDRLNELQFDPMLEMILLYRKLQEEDRVMCQIRDGSTVFYNDDGRVIRYSAHAHVALQANMQKITADLLRYGYGRVPETITVDEQVTGGLIINLTDA